MNSVTPTLDTYRPAIHYAARNTWLNDPNGLVFHEGVYHLYYQNNPYGNVHSNMSWGHATSADLVSWEEQPVAIPCDETEDIFSGSVVVDTGNTSGFGADGKAPLVAIYTSAYKPGSPHQGTQAQSVAWSTDGGYAWTKYAGNPVLTRNSPEFRDPKVFRYNGPAGSYWVMVAVEAHDFTVLLYRSEDLKNWEYLSTFGPANGTGGIWECPDLFELPLNGDASARIWILTVNMNPGGPNGGSAGQYFVGEFDGATFRSETSLTEGMQDPERVPDYQWLDWGRDYYAAVSFSNVPNGRRLMIGWMNNWQYANHIPTSPWRSPMSLVRDISLVSVNGQPRLIQQPAPEVKATSESGPLQRLSINGQAAVEGGTAVQAIDIIFTPGSAEEFGLVVRGSADGTAGTRIGIRPRSGELIVDRTRSGDTGFHEAFPSTSLAPIAARQDGSYALQIFVDHCSVEIFANDGLATVTELIFPDRAQTSLTLYSTGGTADAALQLIDLGKEEA
ncbi:glycoside hydrolase family 32 protein [Pseudarthrobacter sp902506025]|uniref:Sucrose-6-phosphate hydrolase SacC (GH32 family) n=1 Tax=Pseudarthrobacter defluvii TaxID=410837 RepID=A0ABT9UGK5_9MICC|nr:glycoside hydrolase family 32 protein [Pseudarthrobacter defluvii]MDQ0118760.1 sucrose-6-phosphate hydrolase SacC (GH32 family) [Pseudarthrobacter defluvii]